MRAVERSPDVCLQKVFGNVTVNNECMQRSISHSSLLSNLNSEASSDDPSTQLLNHEDDLLYWWYLQYEHHSDPIGKIQEVLQERNILRTRSQILQDLFSQGIVNVSVYNTLTSKESSHMHKGTVEREDKAQTSDWDSILHLVRELIVGGYKLHINWLQRTLLETCYVKSELRKTEDYAVEDPVPFYCHVLRQSIPLVPYSESQEGALQSEMFTNLLHVLGFHMPSDVGKVYPRIPSFWTTDILYNIAQGLGPTSQLKGLKFSINELELHLKNMRTNSSCENMEELPEISFPVHTQSSFTIPRMIHSDTTINQNNISMKSPTKTIDFKLPSVLSKYSSGSVQSLTHQQKKFGRLELPHGHLPSISPMNWMTIAKRSKTFKVQIPSDDKLHEASHS